ncbi:MAG: hypothetical protein HC828_17275, partial [Blastochloris sp.]|nr:hypothetical protein [Blastochloris sp.]
ELDPIATQARILASQYDRQAATTTLSVLESNRRDEPDELFRHEQFANLIDDTASTEQGSYMTLPLVAQQSLIGTLSVGVEPFDTLDDDQIDIAREVAALLAIGLRQTQLYEQTRQDAETKATLLREVNHRVKNNLTAIIALLYAERRRHGLEHQPDYQALIYDLVSRVQSLATVHDLLSASDWRPLRMSDLVEHVITLALQALPLKTSVKLDINDAPVFVTPDQAHNLALIINELATNTVKHGVPAGGPLRVEVRIECIDGTIQLLFRDNGPGYSAQTTQPDPQRAHIGLDLIRNIVRHSLRGMLSIANDDGAVTTIRFENTLPTQ